MNPSNKDGTSLLYRPASHFIIELGTKRNAVQLGFVPYYSGFGFQLFSSYWHAFRDASELSASIIPVR
jgi:hypothetical protein